MVRFLLRKGVNIHAVSDGRRDTALHFAVMCPWEPRRLELVQILINAGRNPHSHNLQGETPFTIAIKRGYSSVVELLLSCNVPIHANILLFILRQSSTPQIIQSLILKGADVRPTMSNGDTVLHLAIAEYVGGTCLDLVKIFIQAGCNPTAYDSEGKTVLEAAIKRGHTLVVDHLLACNVPFPHDILLTALQLRSTLQMVQFLIHEGADVHSTAMSNGDAVLHLAIADSHLEGMCWDLVRSFIDAAAIPPLAIPKEKQSWQLPSSVDTRQW